MAGLFSKILFIYVLFLAVSPCGDNCVPVVCQLETSAHFEPQHSDEHNECPPLCNCLCCNTTVSAVNNFALNISVNSTYCRSFNSPDLTPHSLKPTSPPPKA
jgi:hypothetical protein